MIYLIKSFGYTEGRGYFDLLKIGYTRDNNYKSRLMTYKYHNPTCELLYFIPEATEVDEDNLQYYFRDYQFINNSFSSSEWFYYNDEIVDYFKTHTTRESLSSLPNSPSNKRSAFREYRREVVDIVKYVLNVRFIEGSIDVLDSFRQIDNMVDHIIDELHIRTISRVWEYVKDTFGILPKEINSIEDNELRNEVGDFMIKFGKAKFYTDKMRLLCESGLSEKALSLVLKQIPIDYSTYYIALGSERLKARGYKRGELEKEYISQKESVSGSLKEVLILNNFVVGERYSVKSVKEKLKELYSQNNIKTTPKAVELFNYFDIMKTRVKDETTGKFIDAYRILKKKINVLS